MSRWFYKGAHPTSLVVNGVEVPVAPRSYVEAPRAAIRVPALFVLADHSEVDQPVAVAPAPVAEVRPEAETFPVEPQPIAEPDVASPAAVDVVSSTELPDDTSSSTDEDNQGTAEAPPVTEHRTRRSRQR